MPLLYISVSFIVFQKAKLFILNISKQIVHLENLTQSVLLSFESVSRAISHDGLYGNSDAFWRKGCCIPYKTWENDSLFQGYKNFFFFFFFLATLVLASCSWHIRTFSPDSNSDCVMSEKFEVAVIFVKIMRTSREFCTWIWRMFLQSI